MKEMKQNNYTRFLIFAEIREPATQTKITKGRTF